MKKFQSFSGIVTGIEDFMVSVNNENSGCNKLMTLENESGNIVNFVITPFTYFINHEQISVGDKVTGFYDAFAPAIMIYPPQYTALVVAKNSPLLNIEVDYFDYELVNSDNTLKLNLAPYTQIVLENGQTFDLSPANRNLIVVYGAVTRSIPAQTTPYKIIVMCRMRSSF